jgi:glucosamine--fructose-6-phosphate aminotransferase (isomerizing)
MTFKDEMNQQPKVLRDCINKIFDTNDTSSKLIELIKRKGIDSFIFTGMGSSLFVGRMAVLYLLNKGIRAIAVESVELLLINRKIFDDKTLIVAISQSGESTEVIELVDNMLIKENLIVVTNYTGSKLYTKSNIIFNIHAGIEYLTSTKTYTNTIAVVLYITYLLSDSSVIELAELKNTFFSSVDQMEKLMTQDDLADELAKFIKDIKFLLCVGSGYSYTSACHSEIVLEEAGKFYSSRYTPGQFIHGPIELIQKGFGVIIFDFDPVASKKCNEVCHHVLAYEGKVVYITNNKKIKPEKNLFVCQIQHSDPMTAPLVEIVPVEMAINSLVLGRGKKPGKLSRVTKRIVN